MAVLSPSEYDASYFEGRTQSYTHNAGYSNYSRVQYNTKSELYGLTPEESTGTIFGDLIKSLNLKLTNRFIGKSVLVIGCAYGFEVEGFRSLGVEAVGVDVSTFAINQAKPEIQPYLEVADIRTKVSTYSRNQFDYVFSRWFLECLSDTDLALLIPEMGRICKSGQCHIINPFMRSDYYNPKTIQGWASLPFTKGTILIENSDFNNFVIV